ncbi:MAG: glycosyltransferase family 2 protein [Geobacteraceae bacterium]|nr:glycosyltransferase family 2 protein [Geobacteraceae bacterium]
MEVFCSTIIPTINRSTLSRAVQSVLDQSSQEFGLEVIVVNDSGQPLPEAGWQQSEWVRVINTNRRERSVARNTGAAIARGKYLHFLDDDDWILPDAISALWALDQISDAVWLYGSYQTVDNEGNIIQKIHPERKGNILALLVAGHGIPLQASLVEARAFFAAGGFDPMITGVEDRDLGRRLALIGEIAYSPHVVASIRIGEQGSTTDWGRLAEDDRRGREKALSAPSSYARLRTSACSDYWRGRVSRAYFASAVWNFKRLNILTAFSRGITGLVFAGGHAIRPKFWLGLRESDYENRD